MDGYEDATYGDRIAERYDQWYPSDAFGGAEQTVAFLAAFAGNGPALELGIGTGRIAIPLAAVGVRVHGIDASDAMVAKLRAKEPAIEVLVGSFADFSLSEPFSLIYVVFNTFFGLLTRDEQASSMRAIARHLRPGGVFVMEAFVPDPGRFHHGQRVGAMRIGVDEVGVGTEALNPRCWIRPILRCRRPPAGG